MDLNILLEILAAALFAGGGYWVRGIDTRVQALESESREIRLLRETLERHVKDEDSVWERLEGMDRRADDRNTKICERLAGLEAVVVKGGRE